MPATEGTRARHDRRDGPLDPAKRATLKKLGALGLLALVDINAFVGCGRKTAAALSQERKVIVLGLDGLDPRIVHSLMAQGKLPQMQRLQARGAIRTIASTTPPQSPVAWATVITGRDPGGHGIYDFIQRDPKSYLPYFSIARSRDAAKSMSLGSWRIPLSHGTVESLRGGRAFWEYLTDAGIPASIYRMPSNFPPHDNGARQLAGLGAPDLLGTYGMFSYYTDTPLSGSEPVSGGEMHIVSPQGGQIRTHLRGPRNSLRNGDAQTRADLMIALDREHKVAKIVLQNQEVLLKQGEWSDWLPVTFEMMPHVSSAKGMCRFYLQEVSPRFRLYVTPINIDPLDPALPIAAPGGFAQELAARHGRFYTQGFPHDVKALRSGIWDEDEYLHQSAMVFSEERRMYESALNGLDRGLLFYVAVTTDRTQHMYWRAADPRHPAYSQQLARGYGSIIDESYQDADALVGKTLDALDGRTTLIVMSDHGFSPYYRSFELNTWLAQNGYLAGADLGQAGADIFSSADWGNTQAYGLGFNSIYLNLRGREAKGSVDQEERAALLDRLASQLREVRDPKTGARVVANSYRADETYLTHNPGKEPDLIVGYAAGYRCSDGSILGGTAQTLLEDNYDKWSGDHCVDVSCVPGTLMTNRPVGHDTPSLQDIAASVLSEFGITTPSDMTSKPIW